jgi:hypothetical protein
MVTDINYSKSDALDIEREQEYREMVEKIKSNTFKKVNIIFTIDDIRKRCVATVSNSFLCFT